MIERLERLIEALRDELQQYGEMLARLDRQQELVMRRAADELLQATADIEAQSRVIQESRRERGARQRELAEALRMPPGIAFAELVPALPPDYRPLVSALVEENNELLARVHQRSRQNHVLLSRSLELMSRLMSALVPGGSTVYTERGDRADTAGVASPSIYHAVG